MWREVLPEEYQRFFSSQRVFMKDTYGSGESSLGTLASWKASKIAEQEYQATQPLRDIFMQDWMNIAQGGQPQFMGTMFSGMRQPIEQQYGIAKENILGSLPQGGALQSELANLETSRALGLQGALQNIWSDQIAKMYGYTTGAPQIAIAGMSGAGQNLGSIGQGKTAAQIESMGQPMSVCCWNFLAAHGSVPEEVKRYRDEHYPKGCPVSKGYKWMSEFAVPLMEQYPKFAKFMDWVMAQPMTKYAQWYYGLNRYGWIFKPIADFWVSLWGEWGKLPETQKYYQGELEC